ncbi:MAG: cupredoxin domain-containing protein [Patescibacteria group bacterium]|nr:cupredoxin domain-containing protein [Patescibacteria group bacterium]
MNKKNIIIVVVVIIIVVGVVYLFSSGVIPSPRTSTPSESEIAVEGSQGTAVAPGTSAVTQDGEVVTQEGVPVKLDVEPGSPEAPQQSNPVSEESLPKEAIKLQASETGFSPNAFSVKSGTAVTLSLTTADDRSHIFKFKDPSLSAVAIGVGTSKTRAITFNAPSKGDYSFFCDVPGHEARGETGVMTVR